MGVSPMDHGQDARDTKRGFEIDTKRSSPKVRTFSGIATFTVIFWRSILYLIVGRPRRAPTGLFGLGPSEQLGGVENGWVENTFDYRG